MEEFFTNINNLWALVIAEVLAAIPVAIGILWKKVKATIGPDRMETLTSVARVAVFAAEELGHNVDDITSKEKLRFAIAQVQTLAGKVGINVSPEEAQAFIEAVLNEVRTYAPDQPLPFNVEAERLAPPVE